MEREWGAGCAPRRSRGDRNPLALETCKLRPRIPDEIDRRFFWNDSDLLDEGDEVNCCAVWLLPSSAPTRQPALFARRLIGFANSRSEQELD
jgi:hypothetical protein